VPPPSAAPSPLRCWLGFAAFYTAAFAVLAVFMQFFPVWLKDVAGLRPQDVSVVMAAQTIARTVAGPLWAHRADRQGQARGLLVGLSFASAGTLALWGIAHPLWWCVTVALLFGSLYSPMYPILDAAALQAGSEHGFVWSRMRMIGSTSYLVVLLAAGVAFEATGSDAILPTLVVGGVLMGGCSLLLSRPQRATAAADSAAVAAAEPWWALLRSRPFVVLLAASALIQGSHATFYNLSTVHWGEHGIDKATASVLWAEGIVAEIVVFFVAKDLFGRLRPTTIMAIGGLGAVVRWVIVGATTSVPLLAATNWLHGVSFAATYLGTLRALERRVQPHQRATAQGLLGAANSGIGMVVCGLVGGAIYERAGGVAFTSMAAFAAAGIALTWWLRRAADRRAVPVPGPPPPPPPPTSPPTSPPPPTPSP
jgi:PPP family 3-phenylpropionic acid transporter